MKRISMLGLVLLAGFTVLMGTGCNKLKSRDHLNKGIQSFRGAQYNDAIEHFKTAIDLDPDNANARLYLATAYMQQWIPGAESPENLQMAKAATDGFLKVLERDPNDKTALESLASLNYNAAQSLTGDAKTKKLDDAGDWYKKLLAVDPKKKEAYYSLGVISWAKWYPALMGERAKLGMKPEDPGPLKDKKVKEELKTQYSPMIESGLQNLQKALDIDPQYDDAMSYINLLIRERADLAESADQYKKDIQEADGWMQKALDTRKAKAAKQPGATGITTEAK